MPTLSDLVQTGGAFRTTGLYNKPKPTGVIGGFNNPAASSIRKTGLFDKTMAPAQGQEMPAMTQGPASLGGSRGNMLGSLQQGQTPQYVTQSQLPYTPPTVDPSKLTGTNKDYYDAMGMLGQPVNDAQLMNVQLDRSLDPSAIQMGQLTDAQRAQLQGADSLSSLYGNIDYDRNSIEGIFQDATNAKYAAQRAEYARSAGAYGKNLATNQDAYLDAMRKANAGSIQSGVNAGLNNANALSALLGMSQQSSADATKLAQDYRALTDKEAAERAQNTRDAMDYANQQKLALGTLGSNIYAADTQQYAAELGANAQIQSANTAAGAQQYASDRNLQGTMFNSQANLAGQKYASDTSYNSSIYNTQGNLYGNMFGSNKNLEGTKYAADQALKGARAQAGAMAAAARISAESAANQATAQAGIQEGINNTQKQIALLQTNPNAVLSNVFGNGTVFGSMAGDQFGR